MEEYIRRPGVPEFLYPASTAMVYTSLNLTDPKEFKKENYKYHHYYSNLSSTLVSPSTQSNFYPSDNFEYYRSHKVYKPLSIPKSTTDGRIEPSRSKKYFQNVNCFMDSPPLFGDAALRGVSYGAGADMPDGIYTFGGLECMLTPEYEEMLKKITQNFTIPPENIKLECDYDIPFPIDKEKIESMSLKPCLTVKKYLPESNCLRYVCELNNDQNENELEDDRTSFNDLLKKTDGKIIQKNKPQGMATSSSSSYQDTPKSLICATASKVSNRFFATYGGLEIITEIKYPDDQHCIIEKKLIPNDQLWLFDTITCKFREIKLSVHPTYSSIFPNTVPRFGHGMVSISVEENINLSKKNELNHDFKDAENHESKENITVGTFSKPATIFVMGGYRAMDDTNKFVAINDLWKCDLFLDDKGAADEVLAAPIGDFEMANDYFSYNIDDKLNEHPNNPTSNKFTGVFRHSMGNQWPSPRGFFSMNLIDNDFMLNYVDWKSPCRENASIKQKLLQKELLAKRERETEQNLHTPLPTTKLNFSFTSAEYKKPEFTRTKTTTRITGNHGPGVASDISSRSDSPSSELSNHTSSVKQFENKVLILIGGSSIMYTKVSDDEQYDVYYNKYILGDIWVFDFQTESWYNFEEHVKIKRGLQVCGHMLIISPYTLNVVGGVAESHYDESLFEPIQGGLSRTNNWEHKVQTQNWSRGKECVSIFHREKRKSKPKNHFDSHVGVEITKDRTAEYNHFSAFIFDFQKSLWNNIQIAIVNDHKYFVPWEFNKSRKIMSGGTLLNTDFEDGRIKNDFDVDKEPLGGYGVLAVCGLVFYKDNRTVLISPDLKVLDEKRKCILGKQRLVGNSIADIYSSYI